MSNQLQEISDTFCMKELVEKLLTEGGYAEKRARTLTIEDFLGLLLTLNKENIHFRDL